MAFLEKFKTGKTVYSFEVFPPKRTSKPDGIYKTLDGLKGLKPDFISVTYGAGGNEADETTCRIAADIQTDYGIEAVAHLTCAAHSKAQVRSMLQQFSAAGVKNIMALRGDIAKGSAPAGDFIYAVDLIKFIKEQGAFQISAACYPEGHVECENLDKDIENLKRKVDAGAEHLVSQLFFDNSFFYNFMNKARSAGIATPIEAGIMPVVNKAQIERMVMLCGASLPVKFTRMMARYADHPEALQAAGIAYAAEQIIDLAACGAQGIHLYTMNNPTIAEKITAAVQGVVRLNV